MVFVDNFESLSEIQKAIENLSNSTVNGKPIKNNPVLSSLDILIGQKLNDYAANTNIYTILSDLDSAYQEGYSIKVSEDLDGAVIVSVGIHSFKIQTTGGGLSVRTQDNTIIFDSNALTSINAEAPLEWTKDRKLIHQDSGVTQGTYGTDSD
jgi:RNA recognition motif-containing protein